MGETQKPMILYIDDEPGMIDLVRLVLERRGCRVVGAFNAQAGIEAMHQEKPDLVLLDIMMPQQDGWEVYRYIRGNPDLNGLPVIIISARTQPIEVILAKEVAKVDDYIPKPFGPKELVKSVEGVLGKLQDDPRPPSWRR